MGVFVVWNVPLREERKGKKERKERKGKEFDWPLCEGVGSFNLG